MVSSWRKPTVGIIKFTTTVCGAAVALMNKLTSTYREFECNFVSSFLSNSGSSLMNLECKLKSYRVQLLLISNLKRSLNKLDENNWTTISWWSNRANWTFLSYNQLIISIFELVLRARAIFWCKLIDMYGR